MKLLRVIALFGLGTLAASADQFVWGNTYAQAWQGVGTGPYAALGSGANSDITIFCMDFNDEIAPPFTWDATVRNLTQGNVSSAAQYGGNYNNLLNQAYQVSNPSQAAPNQVSGAPFAFQSDNAGGGYAVNLAASSDPYTRYLEAAWLFTELEDAGGQSPLGLVAQVAAWDLFVNSANIGTLANDIATTGGAYNFVDLVDPAGTATPGAAGLNFEQAVDYALTAAQAAVVTNGTFNGAGWTIVTADPTWVEGAGDTIPAQEFLSPNAVDPPPVPEPSAMILFATASGMLYCGKRWRKRA